jgi:hypothetical protein
MTGIDYNCQTDVGHGCTGDATNKKVIRISPATRFRRFVLDIALKGLLWSVENKPLGKTEQFKRTRDLSQIYGE